MCQIPNHISLKEKDNSLSILVNATIQRLQGFYDFKIPSVMFPQLKYFIH